MDELVTSEDGAVAVFRVFLSSQPSDDVSITFNSSDQTEGNVSPEVLTFTPQSWKNPSVVTVTGKDDDVFDHDQSYVILTGATSSSDKDYDAIELPNVSVMNLDNESCSSPPEKVTIEFSSFEASNDPYVCVVNAELRGAVGGRPLVIEQGADVRIFSPEVYFEELFKVEAGGVLRVAPKIP